MESLRQCPQLRQKALCTTLTKQQHLSLSEILYSSMFFIRLKKYRSYALFFADSKPLSLCYILERVKHIFQTESPLIHF